jgi:hypothetical protein
MQRRMARDTGCDPVIELDADHWPWMSRPGEFVEALERVVRASVAQPR